MLQANGQQQCPQQANDEERLGHQSGRVIDEVDVNRRYARGRERDPLAQARRRTIFSKQLPGQVKGEQRLKHAHGDGLNEPRCEGVRAQCSIDGRQVEGVEKTPVRRWLVGRGHRPPGFAKAKSVAAEQAESQRVIGDLVERSGQSDDCVSQIDRRQHAQQDRKKENEV